MWLMRKARLKAASSILTAIEEMFHFSNASIDVSNKDSIPQMNESRMSEELGNARKEVAADWILSFFLSVHFWMGALGC